MTRSVLFSGVSRFAHPSGGKVRAGVMKQKSQYNKIQEAFSCTSIEKRGITVVCIAIILITLLFRYGRFLLFDVEQPVGDEEVYSL